MQVQRKDEWYMLDPNGTERGPYPTRVIESWLGDGVRVRNGEEASFMLATQHDGLTFSGSKKKKKKAKKPKTPNAKKEKSNKPSKASKSAPTAPRDFTFKIGLIGDKNVGKTSLLTRLAENTFTNTPTATIGMNTKTKTMVIDGNNVKLQLFDTGGQEGYKTISAGYYKALKAVVIVYDVADAASHKHVASWIREIDGCGVTGIKKMVVGNKTDLNRAVSHEQGQSLALSQQLSYAETSAKTGSGVEEAFRALAKELMDASPAAASNSKSKSSSKGKSGGGCLVM